MANLADMEPGQSGWIVKVNAGGVLAQRMLDMGLCPGVFFSVVRNAPLQEPLEVEVDGFLVSLRRSEARCLEVREEP